MQHLAVSALVKSAAVADIEGGCLNASLSSDLPSSSSSSSKHLANWQANAAALAGQGKAGVQDGNIVGAMGSHEVLDASEMCGPALKVLRGMVQAWVNDAVNCQSLYADALLQHLQRWIGR